jgi:energy-coupling factor transporter ATP-binding protein EcfA2
LPRFWISRIAAPLESDRAIIPRPDLLARLLGAPANAGALTLEQVALSFGGVHAIDDLDLEIRPGQVHGLIGPNGSGKTTTLNVISGYYAQQRGAVRLNGAALPVFDRHQRADAGLNLNTEHLPRVFVATYDAHPIGERREVFSPAHQTPSARRACPQCGGRVVIT